MAHTQQHRANFLHPCSFKISQNSSIDLPQQSKVPQRKKKKNRKPSNNQRRPSSMQEEEQQASVIMQHAMLQPL